MPSWSGGSLGPRLGPLGDFRGHCPARMKIIARNACLVPSLADPTFSIMPVTCELDPRAEQCFTRCRSPPVRPRSRRSNDVEAGLFLQSGGGRGRSAAPGWHGRPGCGCRRPWPWTTSSEPSISCHENTRWYVSSLANRPPTERSAAEPTAHPLRARSMPLADDLVDWLSETSDRRSGPPTGRGSGLWVGVDLQHPQREPGCDWHQRQHRLLHGLRR